MASQKTTGSKPKFKGPKPARASALPPQTPAAFRPHIGATPLTTKPSQAAADTSKPARAPKLDGAEDTGAPLKKQELIAKVVERSDVSKKHAKPVIEAMLAILGEAIGEGRELNLQPLGKIKRKRMKETGKARVIIANIRQPSTSEASTSETSAATVGSTASAMAASPRPQTGKAHADPSEKEAVADNAE